MKNNWLKENWWKITIAVVAVIAVVLIICFV